MKHTLLISRKLLLSLGLFTASFMLSISALAAPATAPINLARAPLTTSTTTVVKPNLMFVLDNSGSMDWDHMPDDDSDGGSDVSFRFGYYGLRSSQCNQVYYNPATNYLPPVDASGNSYPDASFTSAYGGTGGGFSGGTTVNLNTNFKASADLNPDSTAGSAYYYSYSGSQISQLQKNYNSTSNTFYNECNSAEDASPGKDVFSKRRLATTEKTTIVVGGSSGTNVSINNIKVNNVQLMSGASTGSTNTSTVAANIAAKITLNGFSATASGNTITITGPTSAANYTPIVTQSTSMTFTADVFPDTTPANLTNFANWYSYYRTRMLMMKTAAGRAFSELNNNYRVGLMKISSSTPSLEVNTFENAHRTSWYNTLYATSTSGSTPLRRALSDAGRYFAGKLGGTDPVQYSCQQNFSILSTDGYWNTGDGYMMDGSTPVGNQDGTASRPMYDGAQAGTTVTTTYTREQYTKGKFGCSGTQRRLQTQPEIGSCSVTTVGGVSGTPSCNWVNDGPATYGSCGSSGSINVPNPNPSTAVQSGIPVTTPGASGGTSDNLADIAMYYYSTDLRPGTCILCTDNVFTSTFDNNIKQHMTTFTLGLGASGLMNYSSSYLSDSVGDFVSVKLGSTANLTATPPVCSWQANGTTCNWPEPGMSGSNGLIANVDDLWHAAVNGRGAYFSATNPETLSTGLANALSAINARKGAAAAAAASTLNPVAGDNFAYVASYTTVAWKGNLEAREVNTMTGEVNQDASWCAESVTATPCTSPSTLVSADVGNSTVQYCVTPNSVICNGGVLEGSDCKVPVATACSGTMATKVTDSSDTRKIWTKGANAASLNNFKLTGGDLNAADFNATKLAGLSQWASLDATQKAKAIGDNVVNYLRGQTGFEDRTTNDDGTNNNRLFRYREATLGDAIESQPAFIGKPTFNYIDPGYATFKSNNLSRPGTVYMGANDGMMHAFDALTGNELWAYVPSMLTHKMFALADNNYATNHDYYANGSPIISDIYDGGTWKTILVAGLNGGGRGYYALDITNPLAPILLWEFTPSNDVDLGYTFGNPVITKKADGTWVVLVTSGYNNIPDTYPRVKYPLINTGNGQGYLYVLNAATGSIINKIGTGVGSATVPSGFAQIAAWADEPEKNNEATFVYGGDLLGNVWRFDINANTVVKFAELKEGSTGQPVTTRPELGKISAGGKIHRLVFIGTGKYLETSDLTDLQQQTLYAIKDDDTPSSTPTATLVNPRSSSTMVEQVMTTNGNTRTVTNNVVDFGVHRGWFVDFSDAGERQNVASQLVLGTLLTPTTVPSNTVCSPGGSSWLSYFNYGTGGLVKGATDVSIRVTEPIVGMNVMYIEDSNGKKKPVVSTVTAGDPTPVLIPQVQFSGSGQPFQKKRVIWRELIE